MELEIKNHIKRALEEDLQQGDFSSIACIEEDAKKKAKLVAKDNGIICGLDVFCEVFNQMDTKKDIKINKFFSDGERIKKGDIVLTVNGNARNILSAERTALNYIQLLSGIATKTAYLGSLLQGTNTKLLDTRKTTPTLRLLEKYAVKVGGGENHRFGLFDMIMLKDNHIDFAGGIKQAIEKTNKYLKENKKDLKIEIEIRNFAELKQVMEIGQVDRIMLDNFSPIDAKKAVFLIDHRFETECSGGINEQTIKQFAQSGVDFISVGALTHHISALDLSLMADE